MPTIHLTITGKVQGVFYRVSAKKTAARLGITGWVKNTASNNVEVVANGTTDQLNEFVTWCRTGPSNARVDDVITKNVTDQQFDEFKILH